MAAVVSSGILVATTIEKFGHGGWLTLLITGSLIVLCIYIRRHYRRVAHKLAVHNQQVVLPDDVSCVANPPLPDKANPTAVFLVSQHLGLGMQLVMAVLRLFPNRFKNFVFLRVGEVDSKNFGGEEKLIELKRDIEGDFGVYTNYMHHNCYAVDCRYAYGPDKLAELLKLTDAVAKDYPDVVFFSAKLLFEDENFFTRMLHNNTAYAMQRHLHLKGLSLMILPIRV
jgi:hypothetical protein